MESGQSCCSDADPQGAIVTWDQGINNAAWQFAVGCSEDLPETFMESGQSCYGADP